LLHREGSAAASVAVELRQDDAVEFELFVEEIKELDTPSL